MILYKKMISGFSRSHSTQTTQHETGYQCIEHVTVFMGRRNDNR